MYSNYSDHGRASVDALCRDGTCPIENVWRTLMNMLMSLENNVGKIRDIYLNSLYIPSVSAVLLKIISETSTPTQYGRIF